MNVCVIFVKSKKKKKKKKKKEKKKNVGQHIQTLSCSLFIIYLLHNVISSFQIGSSYSVLALFYAISNIKLSLAKPTPTRKKVNNNVEIAHGKLLLCMFHLPCII